MNWNNIIQKLISASSFCLYRKFIVLLLTLRYFVVGFSSARRSTCCWFCWWIFETLWRSVTWTVSCFIVNSWTEKLNKTSSNYNFMTTPKLFVIHHLISFLLLKACLRDSASSESWKSCWTQFSAWTWSRKGCKLNRISELSAFIPFFLGLGIRFFNSVRFFRVQLH